MLVVKVDSAGYDADGGSLAVISLNGFIVKVESNENNHYRGLHIVIFNPVSGMVQWAKAYDTYKSVQAFDEFIDNPIPAGYIIIAACMDECATNLSKQAKFWFSNMGSKEIADIEYRQAFAFIGISGGESTGSAQERRARSVKDKASVTQIFHIKVNVDKSMVSAGGGITPPPAVPELTEDESQLSFPNLTPKETPPAKFESNDFKKSKSDDR